MDAINVTAKPRETGKKATRAVRREDQVPCVLYSRSTATVPFQMPALQLKRIAFARSASRVEIALDGQAWSCILKDIDLHPITDEPLHADFQVLQEGEMISLTVPVHFHGTPYGQTEGGDTQYVMNEIDIKCLPDNIPAYIDLDVSDLDIGEAIHVYDLEVEGVAFEAAPEQTLVTVVAPYVEPVETEEALLEGELAEEGELVEGEEGELPGEAAEGEAAEGEAAEGAAEGEEGESFDEDL